MARWKTKAKNRGIEAAFDSEVLPGSMADWIAESLRAGWRLEAVFEAARDWAISGRADPPTLGADEQQAAEYWQRFDQITDSLEDSYHAYIEAVSADIFNRILDHPQAIGDIDKAFEQHLPALQTALVGTVDEPGLLSRLHIAGQAAGAYLLAGSGKGASPARSAVEVDFKARFDQAVNYAKFQSGQLITNISSIARFGIMQAVAQSIEESWTRDRLYKEIAKYLTPPGEKPSKQVNARAKLIGDTEKIFSYNAGALDQFKAGGAKRAKWSTVSVGEPHICRICAGLHGQEADIDQGWYSDRTKKYYKLSAHPRCRCFRVPIPRVVAPTKEAEQRIEDDPDSVSLQQALQIRAVEYERLADQLTHITEAAKAKTAAARADYEKAKQNVRTLDQQRADLLDKLFAIPSDKRFKPYGGPEYKAWDAIQKEVDAKVEAARQEWIDQNAGKPGWQKKHDKYAIEVRTKLELEAEARPEYLARYEPEYAAIKIEMRKAQQAVDQAEAERDKLRKKYEKQEAAESAQIRQQSIESLAGKGKGLPVTIKADTELTRKENAKRMKELEGWLSSTFSKPLHKITDEPVTAYALPKGSRAYHSYGEINVTAEDVTDGYVVIHEYGHAIEYRNQRIHERCIEFLLGRSQGRVLHKLSELTGDKGYRDDEVAFKGNFVDPYVGKAYRDRGRYRASEVLSMGLERLYNDPVAFRKEDPGYFDFITLIIRDYL